MTRKTATRLLSALPIPGDLDAREQDAWRREFDMAGAGHFTAVDVPAMRTHIDLVVEADDARERMVAAEFGRAEATHYRAMLGLVLASRRMLRMVPSSRLSKQRAATVAAASTTAGAEIGWRALFANTVADNTTTANAHRCRAHK